MLSNAYQVGIELAEKFFTKRAKKYNPNAIEVHLNRTTLSALLAVAFENGRTEAVRTMLEGLSDDSVIRERARATGLLWNCTSCGFDNGVGESKCNGCEKERSI